MLCPLCFVTDIQDNIGQMELDLEHAIASIREDEENERKERRKKPGELLPPSLPPLHPL